MPPEQVGVIASPRHATWAGCHATAESADGTIGVVDALVPLILFHVSFS